MAGIDPTLYEAAKVDGAGRLRMIWHITLPGIRSIIILLFILKLGHLLDAGFDQIYILYNIQVYPVADILDTWVYRTGSAAIEFQFGVGGRIVQVRHWAHLGTRSTIVSEEVGEGIW